MCVYPKSNEIVNVNVETNCYKTCYRLSLKREVSESKKHIWNLLLVSLISPVFSEPEVFQVACLKECFD